MPALSMHRSDGDIVGRHCRNRILKTNIKRINLFEIMEDLGIWYRAILLTQFFNQATYSTLNNPNNPKKKRPNCLSSIHLQHLTSFL